MRILIVIVVLIAGLSAGAWYLYGGVHGRLEYRIGTIKRGDLVATISATGTLEPEEVIDVGAQVAGLIQEFGTDANGKTIDYRSPVEPKMVLARIDDAVYRADVDAVKAQLQQATASVHQGEADLTQAQAKLRQAEDNWNRAKAMGPSDALSHKDYSMYRADYETAKATVSVAEAGIELANSSIAQAQASLTKAQRNLDFCTIRSPVKGEIIDRRVNIGQTVVSSLNAPSLFLIAKDLTRMQIWVAVNEADVGRIEPGTPVTFVCDAFPDKKFTGAVGKVRLNATMAQNVVMYTVEVQTENPKKLLLPYLTAKVQFEVQKAPDVLMVPNAALRWAPSSANELSPANRAAWKPLTDDRKGVGDRQGKAAPREKKSSTEPRERRGTIYVKDGEFVRPVEVKLGLSDGTNTAVTGDDVKEGMEFVVADVTEAVSSAGQKNPLLPQVQRR